MLLHTPELTYRKAVVRVYKKEKKKNISYTDDIIMINFYRLMIYFYFILCFISLNIVFGVIFIILYTHAIYL